LRKNYLLQITEQQQRSKKQTWNYAQIWGMDMSKDEIPSLNIGTRISWEIAGSEGVEFKQLSHVKLFNEDSGSRILDPTNKNRIPDPDPQVRNTAYRYIFIYLLYLDSFHVWTRSRIPNN
jgi:hypothetical protein